MAKNAKYTLPPVSTKGVSILRAHSPVLARLLDKRFGQRRIVPGFGMPLHANREAERRILHGFESPVGRPGRLDEPFAHLAEPLMMV